MILATGYVVAEITVMPAVAAAPLPSPVKVTDGALVYPVPPPVMLIESTMYVVVPVNVA